MSWVRLDDLLPHHRKLVACGNQAPMVLGWYAASIAFASRHFTDGVILPGDLPLLLPSTRPRPAVIEQLVAVKFWDIRPEGGGWVIHDFLEHNNSAEYRREKLRADSERKRNGIRTESTRTPNVEPSLASPSLASPRLASPIRRTTLSGWRPTARRLLTFLNEKTGKSFEPVDSNLRLLEALLKDSRTEAHIRGVIVKKCREWQGDAKMAEYLRPKTLFNKTNFAQYRGDIPSVEGTDAELP